MTYPIPRVVADTSVISHMFREDTIGSRFSELFEVVDETYISFQTLGEQFSGAYSANWGEHRFGRLRTYLARHNVIWPDEELVEVYARVVAESGAVGWTIDAADAWIAATAIHLNCPLATTDRDFIGVPGLAIFGADTL